MLFWEFCDFDTHLKHKKTICKVNDFQFSNIYIIFKIFFQDRNIWWNKDKLGVQKHVTTRKKCFASNKISSNQTNLCIAIRSTKSFFDLKKFLDCFFSLNWRNKCLRSCIVHIRNVIHRNISFNLKKKLSSFKDNKSYFCFKVQKNNNNYADQNHRIPHIDMKYWLKKSRPHL